ncbi:MAG: RimK family alpha-L-glutamate ligase [Gammaproteobacteria bacterium]
MILSDPASASGNSARREPLMGLAALMRLAFSGADLTPVGQRLLARAEADTGDAEALLDLSITLQLKGDRDTALAVQAQALAVQQLYRLPALDDRPRIRLLAIMGAGDLMSNTPLEFLVENSDVELQLLYVGPDLPLPDPLPEHDIAFVAAAESDQNHVLLAHIETLVKSWPRPVLNNAMAVAQLSRDGACRLLGSVPGLVMPNSVRVPRDTLEQIADGQLSAAEVLGDGDFPVIARPVGSHAGRGLHRLDDPAAVREYLQTVPEDKFFLARFVDYRGADGLYRKARIALIDGKPFAAHLAVSQNWMVHYLNAGMTDSADKRAAEARFMAEFDTTFARRHADALRQITERVGLDYFGIDCAETGDGQLLIFEIDSALVVHAMDPVDMYPYKPPQMHRIFDAFRRLLRDGIDGRLER